MRVFGTQAGFAVHQLEGPAVRRRLDQAGFVLRDTPLQVLCWADARSSVDLGQQYVCVVHRAALSWRKKLERR